MRRVYPRVLKELLPAVWHRTERWHRPSSLAILPARVYDRQ
jgi:hypothetical protein